MKYINDLKWYLKKYFKLIPVEGNTQIIERGHRDYVGAKWDVVGKLQIEFLKSKGLLPNHILYDIGCGSLRAGTHFINYLDKSKYVGIDKEKLLIDLGIKKELGKNIFELKKPHFLVSDNFEFEKINYKFDFAIAQSLFTHLTLNDIKKCLEKLRSKSKPNSIMYATFDEINYTKITNKRKKLTNPPFSHSNISFFYHREEIREVAEKSGFDFNYIGDWGHPAMQMMFELNPV